jgi:hypothetical protein
MEYKTDTEELKKELEERKLSYMRKERIITPIRIFVNKTYEEHAMKNRRLK